MRAAFIVVLLGKQRQQTRVLGSDLPGDGLRIGRYIYAVRLLVGAVLVRVDEADYRPRGRSSSAAKKAEAAFKIGGFNRSTQRVL